ncbi:MAG: hypothetical protein IKQ04_10025, partial [Oscillospiraceae bacterium]|nr:hypothetical protein [Oscillospiraceae bacterium]
MDLLFPAPERQRCAAARRPQSHYTAFSDKTPQKIRRTGGFFAGEAAARGGIKDQGSGIRDQGSRIRDQGSGIR